jgi:hypothetical protein
MLSFTRNRVASGAVVMYAVCLYGCIESSR